MKFFYCHFILIAGLNRISSIIFALLIILQYSVIAQTPGNIDPAYFTSKYCNGPITKMISLTGGGFIAIGDFYNCNTGVHNAIVKFNSDLSVDPTFNEQVQSNHYPYALIEYPGNNFLVGGDFNRWDGNPQYSMLVMLNADGTLNTSFNPEFITGTFDRVSAIAIQADGKIIVSGTFNTYGDIFPEHILRINADGSADPSFNTELGGLSSDIALDIVALDDGDILIGGSFDEVNGVEMNGIARLNSDGSLEETFISPFISGGTTINDIQLLPDGKIMVGGDCNILTAGVTSHQDIIRLFSNGTLDNSFAFNSSFKTQTMYLQPDGKIIAGGEYNDAIKRFNIDGSIDPTFTLSPGPEYNNDNGFQNTVSTIIALPADKYLVAGGFNTYNDKLYPFLVKINNDGTVDESLESDFGVFLSSNSYSSNKGIRKMLVSSADNKLYVAGDISGSENIESMGLARINYDGSTDPTFISNIDLVYELYTESVRDIVMKADGKIIAGGTFEEAGGITKHNIVRLNNDGSVDEAFNIGSGFSDDASTSQINALAIQPDGKIIAAGDFSYYKNVPFENLIRLKINGGIDGTFDIGSGATGGNIVSLQLLDDGKIFIAGGFTHYNGIERKYIAKLNADGSLDPSFNANLVNTETFTSVNKILVQPDGKVIISGNDFTKGTDDDEFMRLNADGSYDATFIDVPGNNFGTQVYCMLLDAEGKILIGGEFNKYNNINSFALARLNSDGSFDDSFINPVDDYWHSEGIYSLAFINNELMIGGKFKECGGVAVNNIARLFYYSAVCPIPTGLYADNITVTKATINWDEEDGADSYQLWYRTVGAGTWLKKIVSVNFKTLKSLTPETDYEYKVRTKCSDGEFGEFTALQNFTTLPLREENMNERSFINIFPNPATEEITISTESNFSSASIIISDLMGKNILYQNISNAETTINIKDLPSGMYIIHFKIDGITSTQKFIKQ